MLNKSQTQTTSTDSYQISPAQMRSIEKRFIKNKLATCKRKGREGLGRDTYIRRASGRHLDEEFANLMTVVEENGGFTISIVKIPE